MDEAKILTGLFIAMELSLRATRMMNELIETYKLTDEEKKNYAKKARGVSQEAVDEFLNKASGR